MRLAASQVVDLTDQTRRLASGLSEAYLHCDERQRDEFLYYLLVRSTQSFARLAAPALLLQHWLKPQMDPQIMFLVCDQRLCCNEWLSLVCGPSIARR